MMNDLLRMLMAAADDVGRSFDYATTAAWPPGAVATFQRLGILRRSTGGLYVPCPNCSGGHLEPVIIRWRPDGASRFYISCPESLRVEVSPTMCECWEIDPAGFAGAVSQLMGLKGKPRAIVTDRFWRLGRTPWPPGSSHTREVVLAMRMHEHDAPAVAAHVGLDGRTIVLVPNAPPDRRIWPGKIPAVIVLSEVMRMEDQGLLIDAAAVVEAVKTADATPYTVGGLEITHDDLQLMIRRQIKTDKKTELTDDAMLQAIKIHGGNARAAANALNAEGYFVHHSTISRKLKKFRETYDIDREDDSASVARTVASQRCDRVKKIIERR